jgi:hypothetical protein
MAGLAECVVRIDGAENGDASSGWIRTTALPIGPSSDLSKGLTSETRSLLAVIG